MRLGLFIVSLLIGLVGGAGGILYLDAKNKPAEFVDDIVFPWKSFTDEGTWIVVKGTLAGDNERYPNNTYSIYCAKELKQCWYASIEQRGVSKWVTTMEGPWWFEILEWTPYEVVAGDDGALPACVKTMITIRRETKELFWAEEPVNQTHWLCKDAETKTRKRWIDDSPAQKKMKAREMEIDRRLEKK
jgi:hypothetical protein